MTSDYNTMIIEEFRATGGEWAGIPMILAAAYQPSPATRPRPPASSPIGTVNRRHISQRLPARRGSAGQERELI